LYGLPAKPKGGSPTRIRLTACPYRHLHKFSRSLQGKKIRQPMFLMDIWTIIIISIIIELLLKSISFKTGQQKSIQTAFRSFGEGNSSPEYTS
jgi:hypothetical protein